MIKAIKVATTKHDGYRRGGRAWTKEAQTVALSEFEDEQLAAIQTDPSLVVIECEIEGDEAADAERIALHEKKKKAQAKKAAKADKADTQA